MFKPKKILRNLIILFIVGMFLSEFGGSVMHGIISIITGGIKLFIQFLIDLLLSAFNLK